MNYTSQIKTIVKKESFNTKDGATMNKYIITFSNGHSPSYYTTKELQFSEGDTVTYDLDQAKNKCKIIPSKPQHNYSNPKDDIQKYIIRQSSLNRATDLLANSSDWSEDDIFNLARKFENYVYNG